jgi:hypothetical protein
MMAMYDFYKDKENNILIGDKVIYSKEGSKYNGMEFTLMGIREDDGKFRIKKGDVILAASPDRVKKKPGQLNALDNFKKMAKKMVESGDIDEETLRSFITIKDIDPYNEEDWD